MGVLVTSGITGFEVGSSVRVGEVVGLDAGVVFGVGCAASGWEGVHAAVTISLANNNKIRHHILLLMSKCYLISMHWLNWYTTYLANLQTTNDVK